MTKSDFNARISVEQVLPAGLTHIGLSNMLAVSEPRQSSDC